MKKINWGIIGCGDVAEVKSGPAFNKVSNSELVAVMRRDEVKVRDYATRHKVPKWYTDAASLINDPGINAVYVATPPSSHEEYTMAALQAGKPVYVEKPMSVNAASAAKMAALASELNVKMTVAHYRRAQPIFQKIKQLLDEKRIGDTRFVRLDLYKKALSKEELAIDKTAWRVDPAIAGGGLFYDLAPHQLDLLYYFFGEIDKVYGISINQSGLYKADDITSGIIQFKNRVQFSGTWSFAVAADNEKDSCEIIGDSGTIQFSFFDHKPVMLTTNRKTETFVFDPLVHVQQPMIEKVVEYFLGESPNPCSGDEGVTVMQLLDRFSSNAMAGHFEALPAGK